MPRLGDPDGLSALRPTLIFGEVNKPCNCEPDTLMQVMQIESFHNDAESYYLLRPRGELDAYTVAQFREALADHAATGRLVVDLCGVPFIDSAGLGALIGGIRRIRENEGRVAVFCDGSTLLRLLHTTGFDRIVPIEETLASAVSALDRDPDA